MADTKLTREARVRLSRKRQHQEADVIREELEALSSDSFFNDRFCGDVLLYSALYV